MVAQRGSNMAQARETLSISNFFLPEVQSQLFLHCTQQTDIWHIFQLGVCILLRESVTTMTTTSLFFSE